MKMKKTIAGLLILFLLMTMICSCRSNNQEDSAFNEVYEGGETLPDTDEPSDTDEPTTDEPATDEPTTDEPTTNEPTIDEPTTDKPTTDKPTTDKPTTDEPAANKPTTDEPATDEPDEETTVEYDEDNLLKIMDYNIRLADDGGEKDISKRAPRLKVLVDRYQPDLIGLQEATPKWIAYLESNFLDVYEMRYKYRAETSQESTPLLWKKDKFELLEEGYFWLSDTPEIESKSFCNSYYRICNWVKLKVKATGKVFLYYNTHMSGGDAAGKSGNLIINRAKQQGGFSQYPVLLTGDFNTRPWSASYVKLVKSFGDVNDDLGFDDTDTTNGYNEYEEGSIYDYVMYSPDLALPLKYQVLNEKINGGYVSDHRGIYAEVALKD